MALSRVGGTAPKVELRCSTNLLCTRSFVSDLPVRALAFSVTTSSAHAANRIFELDSHLSFWQAERVFQQVCGGKTDPEVRPQPRVGHLVTSGPRSHPDN